MRNSTWETVGRSWEGSKHPKRKFSPSITAFKQHSESVGGGGWGRINESFKKLCDKKKEELRETKAKRVAIFLTVSRVVQRNELWFIIVESRPLFAPFSRAFKLFHTHIQPLSFREVMENKRQANTVLWQFVAELNFLKGGKVWRRQAVNSEESGLFSLYFIWRHWGIFILCEL